MLDNIVEDLTVGGETSPAVSAPVKYKGIAILGSHPQTKAQAPFNDPGWLVYACSPDNTPHGLSPHRGALPRVDAWFEVHVPVFDKTRPYAYLDWLKNVPKVYMRDRVAMTFRTSGGELLFPNAVPYPEKEVKERFGPFTLTSSIALIMAKAILDIEDMRGKGLIGCDGEPPMMGLWGILQCSDREYKDQRQGTQNMIWNANQSGIKMRVAAESGLFEPPPEDF